MTTVEPQREVVQIIEPIYAEGGGGGGGGGGGVDTLTELTDVTITAPLNREVVVYDASSAQWENQALTKADVGLSNVDNTSDAAKPVSTATASALSGKAASVHTHTASQVTDFNTAADARVQLVVDGAPSALDTLDKLAAAVGDDPAFATTVATALAGKQASDADLTAIAALAPSNDAVIQRKAGAWTSRTPAQLKDDLLLTRGDVGLGNVDNTSDAAKPISTATQTALDGKQAADADLTAIAALAPADDALIQRKAGAWTSRTPTQVKADLSISYADVSGTVPTAALPPLAINEVFPVADQAAMLALTAQRGDFAIREDNGRSYVLSTDSPGTLADWKEVLAAGQVQSVAGKTGVVTLVKADVGLSNVDNTSDAAKPISTATQSALDGKLSLSLIDAAGDLIVGSADNTAARLAKGNNNQLLGVQSGALTWVDPPAGGGSSFDPMAQRFGCLAITMSPHDLGASDPKFIALAAQRLYQFKVALTQGTTVSGIRIPCKAAAAGAGELHFAVFQEDLSRLGTTGNVAATFTGSVAETWVQVPLVAPAATTGDFIWITALSTMDTGPQACFLEVALANEFAWMLNPAGVPTAVRTESVAVMPTTIAPGSGISYLNFCIGVV